MEKTKVSKQQPITDSPWFWFMLFTTVGMSTLLITGGKFGKRQAEIERKSQARTALASGLEITEDATGRKIAVKVPEYSRPGMTKVRLKPLLITFGIIWAVSVVMFVRERVGMSRAVDGPG